jgi:putative phosphoesterase
MHDYDVWIAYVPKFLNKKAQNDAATQAFDKFLVNVKEKKQTCYGQFVQLWDHNKATGFFDKLREKINRGFTMDEKEIAQAAAQPNAKIAVLSDIHANLHALQAVLEHAESHGAVAYLNAGDSIGYGAFPNRVIKLLRAKNVASIMGNYDAEVTQAAKKDNKGDKKFAFNFTKKRLSKTCQAYLLSFPPQLRLQIGDKKVLVAHGSPASIEEHLFANTPEQRLRELIKVAKADVIFVGHSHEQFHREVNGVAFVNPGSAGRPGDGNPQAAYALVGFNPFEVQLFRVNYNVVAAADALRKRGLPESFAQTLLCGVSLDEVTATDLKRKKDLTTECSQIAKSCTKVSVKYRQNTEHCLQVTDLALSLFDGLTKLHRLGVRERCWLECAAILHDIGLSQGSQSHHKKSMDIILNETDLPFASKERRIIASIARYHRKGRIKEKHINLKTLTRTDISKIRKLSSFLRVADALDYTHQSAVQKLNVKISPKKITLECFATQEATLEPQAVNRKKDLLEEVFKKNLVLIWKQK